jgi:hypothetical protein
MPTSLKSGYKNDYYPYCNLLILQLIQMLFLRMLIDSKIYHCHAAM